MKKLYCGVSGSYRIPPCHRLSDIPLPRELLQAFITFYGRDFPLRPAQDAAIFDHNILDISENLIISTPTNSGKSLLSYLLLFQCAYAGHTAVLVEPLRALAYEKAEELKQIAHCLQNCGGAKPDIKITTGDYRLTDEFMHSKPVSRQAKCHGQIIIATPERLDALSRVPENMPWFQTIRTLCFDEAHLLGDPRRGITLELLMAFFRCLEMPPRMILMSATIQNPEELAQWLRPCRVVSGIERYPTLQKWVYALEQEENPDDILYHEVSQILQDPAANVLIFVYQTASAEKLARNLAGRLSGKPLRTRELSEAMATGTAWFHAQMSAAARESVLQAIHSGKLRAVVSTTALSMGINLPATHVFVRDIRFAGAGELTVSDLMQMLGRAGRGNIPGTGIVMLTSSSQPNENSIVSGIANETVPRIQSQLISFENCNSSPSLRNDPVYIDCVGSQILGILSRYQQITQSGIEKYLSFTLGGNQFDGLQGILRKLTSWKLIFQNEDTREYALTHLGKTASQSYLPPLCAANLGQLFRDLLGDDPAGKHISILAPIDYLIILCLVSDEIKPILRYRKSLEQKINAYMESLPLPEKSYLYRTWLAAEPDVLFGSCRVDCLSKDTKKQVCQRVINAMFLYDLSRGYSAEKLKQFYQTDPEDIQERLRDNAIWLLCGMEQILQVKSFYYHLKETCEAGARQIHKADAAFAKASKTLFSLIANLKFRSPLGELVRGIKRTIPNQESYPGEGTLRRLELAGITSLKALVGKSAAELTALGIAPGYANMIVHYISRRLS